MLTTLQYGQEQLTKLINMSQLPNLDIKHFDGDSKQYFTFITSFDNIVHCKDIPVEQKLGLLKRYCRIKAKQVISTCDITPNEWGYNEARRCLKVRFGDPIIISTKWK